MFPIKLFFPVVQGFFDLYKLRVSSGFFTIYAHNKLFFNIVHRTLIIRKYYYNIYCIKLTQISHKGFF